MPTAIEKCILRGITVNLWWENATAASGQFLAEMNSEVLSLQNFNVSNDVW